MYYKSLIHVNEFFQCCKELNKDLKCELTACISERTDIPNVFQTLKIKSKGFKLRQVALKRKDLRAPPCASLTEVKLFTTSPLMQTLVSDGVTSSGKRLISLMLH